MPLRLDKPIAWKYALDPRNQRYYALFTPLRLAADGDTFESMCKAADDRVQMQFFFDESGQDSEHLTLQQSLAKIGLPSTKIPGRPRNPEEVEHRQYEVQYEWEETTVYELAKIAPTYTDLYNIMELFPKT